MEQTKYDVFISYSRKDYIDDKKNVIPGNAVTRIMETLRKAGISYWFDEKGIYSGNEFTEKIITNIEASTILLFLSTKNSNSSPWTSKEIACADELYKYIIPVRIDRSPYNNQVLFRIANRSYIDFVANPDKGLCEIVQSVKMYKEQFEAEQKKEAAALEDCRRREEEEHRRREEEERRCREEEEHRCREEEKRRHREEKDLLRRQLRLNRQQAEDLRAEISKTEEECSVLEKECSELEKEYSVLGKKLWQKKNYIKFLKATRNSKLEHLEGQRQIMNAFPPEEGDYPQAANASIPDVTDNNCKTMGVDEPKNQGSFNCYPANTFEPLTKSTKRAPISAKDSWWKLLFKRKKRLDEVYSSIFAPGEVKRESRMLVQIYVHLFEETEKVKTLALESDKNAERRDYIPLQCKLKKGDKVDVQLNIYGESLLKSEKKSVVWQSHFTKCSFGYSVPKNIDVDKLSCIALLTVNDIPVGEMRFITKIVEDPRKLNPEVIAHTFSKVFISYSHQDESKVKFLHKGLAIGGVPHFFDRSYLKPGDIFPRVIQDYINSADLFILCWSENAAQSEYVKKERIQA